MTGSLIALVPLTLYPFTRLVLSDLGVSLSMLAISLAGGVLAAMLCGGVADLSKRREPPPFG